MSSAAHAVSSVHGQSQPTNFIICPSTVQLRQRELRLHVSLRIKPNHTVRKTRVYRWSVRARALQLSPALRLCKQWKIRNLIWWLALCNLEVSRIWWRYGLVSSVISQWCKSTLNFQMDLSPNVQPKIIRLLHHAALMGSRLDGDCNLIIAIIQTCNITLALSHRSNEMILMFTNSEIKIVSDLHMETEKFKGGLFSHHLNSRKIVCHWF